MLEKYDVMSFGEFIFLWALLFLGSTVLVLFKTEKDDVDVPKVMEAYLEMIKVLPYDPDNTNNADYPNDS